MTHPDDLLAIARMLAAETGRLIIDGRADAEVSATKSSDIDIVTQMDVAAEEHLRARLAELRPHDAVLGEEGETREGTSGVTWVLDPIDGTVNYLYGLPHFAVSVAAVTGSPTPTEWTVRAGAVCDGSGVLWSAARGRGAWRDGAELRRAEGPPLSQTLLATGFQYVAERREIQGRIVAEMLGSVRDIRRLGAAAVDLCLVAAGSLDAYYEHGLRPWDFAAASLIAREAGVRVAGLDGGPADERLVIAAMPDRWDEVRDALIAAGADRTWDAPRA
ncbi:inositol monophosphatase family protein [Demequina sp. NBRC 110056]|uniref:inositol monophosphatase family protein n=1 Tax=Demequina sp. NBRC 110056 TaxID=1570345 RepID=UPI000A05D437|nr:inositol monophosphatase family protein [Demequina sp. NBRC 110056]